MDLVKSSIGLDFCLTCCSYNIHCSTLVTALQHKPYLFESVQNNYIQQNVNFPSYTIRNAEFNPVDISDYNEHADIVFDVIPSDEFIKELEESDDWKKCDDGWYEYAGQDKEAEFSSFYLYIRINPKDKIAKYTYIKI